MRVLLASLFVLGWLCFPALVCAEDRNFLLTWDHPSTGNTPSSYTVGWGTAPGPPYSNHMSLNYPSTSIEIGLTGLVPDTTLYFSVLACDQNADCSQWSAEMVHVVIEDAQRNPPGAPQNVKLSVM